MPSDPKRSVLSELRRPLIQPSATVSTALEERLLGSAPKETASSTSSGTERQVTRPKAKQRVPTVPVTFHLPIELRDKIKITAQAQQKTMLEIAVEAFQDYLQRNKVSEEDLRKLLGL